MRPRTKISIVAVGLVALIAAGVHSSMSESGATPIGTATLRADGTLELQLRAETTAGPQAIGHGLLLYPPDHPDYQRILSHVGPLATGESRPVLPFAD